MLSASHIIRTNACACLRVARIRATLSQVSRRRLARAASTDVTPSFQQENTQTLSGPSQDAPSGFSELMKQMHDCTSAQERSARRIHFNEAREALETTQKQRVSGLKKFNKMQMHKITPLKATHPTEEKKMGRKGRRKLGKDLRTVKELLRNAQGQPDPTMRLESWENSWGEDELKPGKEEGNFSNNRIRKLPSYNRRIEGLVPHSNKSVLEEIEPPTGRVPIATLAHGLDRVLFNPGVHWVQDPRSRVYNFSPYIQTVPDIKNFAFERLPPFVRSSRDSVMQDLAKAHGRLFAGSTSSLSGLLCQIYFLLSRDRQVDVSTLPAPFSTARRDFTPAQRMPAAVVFNYRDGVYMVDSDSSDNDDSQWNVLSWLGTMLENFLTLSRHEFNKLLRSDSPENNFVKQPQAYRYSKSELFVMRSQLDCSDCRLPGTGVFDIKTRAAYTIRLDNLNFQENSGYLIKSQHGNYNSFDREYYDLIRSAFLKYSFQARIGNMDGIFLAYHNTARVFGFEYVPLEEMDARLFGEPRHKKRRKKDGSFELQRDDVGWRVFQKCVGLLEAISTEIIECFPGQSVTCLAETRPGTGILHIWVQPVDEISEPTSESNEIPVVETDPEKPIIQLDVSAESFLGGTQVSDSDEIFHERKPWTVHWAISRSSLSEKSIRSRLAAAKKRKYRPKAYPSGVNAENLEEFFKNLGFGDPESIPDPTNFVPADFAIQFLRELSRQGRLEAERLQLEDDTKGVQVWQPSSLADPVAAPLKSDTSATTSGQDDKC